MNNHRIACVIVTYNRKALLKRCLNAIDAQTYKPQVVYITDNASTDGTMDSVKEWGYYNCLRDGIEYKYILNSRNEGGAGGFYLGMKTAFEADHYDGLWVMDDDGEPEVNCLAELIPYLENYHFISPAVLSIDNHDDCSFFDFNYNVLVSKARDGKIIKDIANPFNGVLFSSVLIAEIGFPKKEMFIWGDERNYQARAIAAGYKPIMVINAKHYHPKDRQKKIKVFGTKYVLVGLPDWKLYCFVRNITYNTKIGVFLPHRLYRLFKELSPYLYYYRKKGIVYKGIFDGLCSNFNNLNKYFS